MNINHSETLFRQFHQLMNLMMRSRMHMRADLPHDMDLGRGQGHLLHILRTHDGMSQKELCEHARIRPASLGELVDKLEQRGFVQRKENENDKRTTNVFLTDKGRELIEKLSAGRAEHMGSMFKGLSEEEQQQLTVLLEKLIGSLQQETAQCDDRGFGPMGFGHGRHSCGRQGGVPDESKDDQSEEQRDDPRNGFGRDRDGFHGPFFGGHPMGGHGRGREDEREYRSDRPQHHSDNILDELFWDAEF